jgi:hypothetical protein
LGGYQNTAQVYDNLRTFDGCLKHRNRPTARGLDDVSKKHSHGKKQKLNSLEIFKNSFGWLYCSMSFGMGNPEGFTVPRVPV